MAIPGIAANAYATTARLGTPGMGLSRTIGEVDGKAGDFGTMLRNVVQDVSATGHKSDVQGQALAAGKANIVDVVTAVAETETAIASLVSVRDKVIQAYEEIMRMTI